MARITRRQREFLCALIELHDDSSRGVHYSAVADQLGVAKVTAYEMLRLLEARGLVEAEYQRSPAHRGPGRSPVVFVPLARAYAIVRGRSRSDRALQEWESTKERILNALREYRTRNYEPLFEEFVEQLHDSRSRLTYLAEMVTAIVLGLDTVREDIEQRAVGGVLESIGLPGEGGLRALAGLGAGLSLFDRLNERMTSTLLAQVAKYQEALSEIGAEGRRRLAEFTQELLEIVELNTSISADTEME
jgi:predicted transcriptional regulator